MITVKVLRSVFPFPGELKAEMEMIHDMVYDSDTIYWISYTQFGYRHLDTKKAAVIEHSMKSQWGMYYPAFIYSGVAFDRCNE